MLIYRTRFAATALIFILATACAQAPARVAPPAVPRTDGPVQSAAPQPQGLLKIALGKEPPSISPKFSGTGVSAFNELVAIFNAPLVTYDATGGVRPILARQLPSQADGSWTIAADGTMVTTYHLRENAKWHDGFAITADDFVFAFQVYLDPDVPVTIRTPESLMSRVEAVDARTLVIGWKGPYFRANSLTYQMLDPLPRHLLEDTYRSNKAAFTSGPEWTAEYVGNGPFRVERWDPGTGLVARAVGDWLLGPPKIAALEIRFITDPNTILANLFSGDVDITTSPFIDVSAAMELRDQWTAGGRGYFKTWTVKMEYLEFQYREAPNWQRAVADVRVRRALMHAIDRDGLAYLINAGFGPPADMFLLPADPGFAEADRAITKYPYDPTRAETILAEVGWRRPRAGAPLTNSDGQSLDVDLWTTAAPEGALKTGVIVDNWKAIGINAPVFVIPAARAQDTEFRTSFPATNNTSRGVSPESFVFTSSQLPTAQNRYATSNRGSFQDPEVDRLQQAILLSTDPAQLRQTTVDLQKRMSDLVGIGPLYYKTDVILAKSSVQGPTGSPSTLPAIAWNISEWEITP